MTIAIKYALFVILATVINIGAPYMSLIIYTIKYRLYPAMFRGTLACII
jgi:hypothetical protein